MSNPHSGPTATKNGPKVTSDSRRNTTGDRASISVGLPYVRGTSEKLAKIFREHGVGTYHKPFNTLRSILLHPKDKTPDLKKCGVIYQLQCPQCPEQYVGETGRTLETRLKEHFKLASPRTAVGEHEHPISQDNVKVIAREDHTLRRKIRESVEIRTRRPAINRDQGGLTVPPDEVAVMVTQASDSYSTDSERYLKFHI